MRNVRFALLLIAALLVLFASTTAIAVRNHSDHRAPYVMSEHPAQMHDFAHDHHNGHIAHYGMSEPCGYALTSQLIDPCANAEPVHNALLVHTPPAHTHDHGHDDPLNVDQQARFDMTAVAARHLSAVHSDEHSYGSTTTWSLGWSVSWMDFDDHHGKTVRVCHALNQHDPHKRYTAVWDPSHTRWTEWEQVR